MATIAKPENLVYERPEAFTEFPTHYCPGCTHGVAHRLIAEVPPAGEADERRAGSGQCCYQKGTADSPGVPGFARAVGWPLISQAGREGVKLPFGKWAGKPPSAVQRQPVGEPASRLVQ